MTDLFDDLADDLPPAPEEAEHALLGLMLSSPEALDIALVRVGPDDFSESVGRLVALTVLDLEAEGIGVTAAVVAERVRSRTGRDVSEFCGQLIDQAPGVDSAEALCERVAVAAQKRAVLALFKESISRSRAARTVTEDREWLADLAQAIAEATDPRLHRQTICDAATAADDIVAPRLEGKTTEETEIVNTGFEALDMRLGGMRAGAMYAVGGRPGSGKTAFALRVAVNVARTGRAVVIQSIEMPLDQVYFRLTSTMSGVSLKAIENPRLLTELDRRRVEAAVTELRRLPLAVDDNEEVTPVTLRSNVRRMFRKIRARDPEARPGLVVVDHLHIMHAPKVDGEYEEVRRNSGAVRKLAREWNAPTLCLCQLNRQLEQRKGDDRIPNAADLRGAGAIEQDAFGILMLHRPDIYQVDRALHNHQALVAVRKVRQGGRLGTTKLLFRGESLSFRTDDDDLIDARRECGSDHPAFVVGPRG